MRLSLEEQERRRSEHDRAEVQAFRRFLEAGGGPRGQFGPWTPEDLEPLPEEELGVSG